MTDSLFDMNLKWAKDEKGFLIRDLNPDWNADFRPAGSSGRVVRNGGRLLAYEPARVAGLLMKFTRVTTPQQLLAFVNSFGPLTLEGFIGEGEPFTDVSGETLWSPDDGEEIDIGLDEVSAFRHLLVNKKRPAIVAKQIEQYRDTYEFEVVPDVRRGLRFVARPKSLLDLLRLRLVQTLMGVSSFTQCGFCSEPFARGVGTTRRADAKYCSDEHRIRFNSQRRSL